MTRLDYMQFAPPPPPLTYSLLGSSGGKWSSLIQILPTYMLSRRSYLCESVFTSNWSCLTWHWFNRTVILKDVVWTKLIYTEVFLSLSLSSLMLIGTGNKYFQLFTLFLCRLFPSFTCSRIFLIISANEAVYCSKRAKLQEISYVIKYVTGTTALTWQDGALASEERCVLSLIWTLYTRRFQLQLFLRAIKLYKRPTGM